MNTNADLSSVNKIPGSFDTLSKESPKYTGSEEEKNWLDKALQDIKNPEKGVRLLERISHQVGTLSSFTPGQIVSLVSLLDQWLKREPDSQEATNYLCQEAIALISKKNLDFFENFLPKSSEKNFAIRVLIHLVRKKQLWPLNAVKDLQKYGIDPHTQEGQQALIEIAKLAAQQNGWGTSQYIKEYGIDASTLEGRQALIEIAKLAAQQNGGGTSQVIKQYGIDVSTLEGRQALIEIAKLAVQQNAKGTSRYIKEYSID